MNDSLEEIVDNQWEAMFKKIMDLPDDDIYEILIEVKTEATGKTIRRSWLDREYRLREDSNDRPA